MNLKLKLATQSRRRKPGHGSQMPLMDQQSADVSASETEAAALLAHIDASAKKASHIYCYLFSPFLLPGMFGKPKPSKSFSKFDSPERYANGISLEQRQTADLYAAVCEDDHEFVSSGHDVYELKFREHLTTHRGHMVKRARLVVPFLFEDESTITAAVFRVSESRSCLDNECICALMGYAADGNPCWPRYPPILNASKSDLPEDRFCSPRMLQLSCGLLYGLLAAQSADAPAAMLSFRSSNTLSSVPDLSSTTGLVSTTATMLRFCLSPDTEFNGTGVGGESKISYIKDHDRCTQLLQLSWHTPGTQHIISHWDRMLFPTSTISPMAGNTPALPSQGASDDSEGEELIIQGLAAVNLQSNKEDNDADADANANAKESPDTADDEHIQPEAQSNSRATSITNPVSFNRHPVRSPSPASVRQQAPAITSLTQTAAPSAPSAPFAPSSVNVNSTIAQESGLQAPATQPA
ncbi:hypothetical protein FA15DRAFT_703865 [Coprinopsis marcescibilis]|uniref:Uncharacterized protein n=1 Tax=Coprinopsis marcescibilis TaxID=230819 RepID=A0A5C3KYQ2_COPMA|nr:hypothetical protein FA15DRAFT_703865 [Coprinopsis marcescibilis]